MHLFSRLYAFKENLHCFIDYNYIGAWWSSFRENFLNLIVEMFLRMAWRHFIFYILKSFFCLFAWLFKFLNVTSKIQFDAKDKLVDN